MSRPVLAALSIVCATSAPVPSPIPALDDGPRARVTGSEEAVLESGDGAAGDRFAYSVALSADGSRALVGVWQDDTPFASYVGSARVFVRTGAGWVAEATLRAADGSAMDGFGGAVALSADGSRALVGAPQDDTAVGQDAGSVHVFSRTGSTWIEEATLVAPDGAAFAHFGAVVSSTADGTRALVGAPYDGSVRGGAGSGSAHLFTRTGTTWTYESRLAAGSGASDRLGQGVALSADGLRAIVGAPGESSGGHAAAGTAHVFSRTGSTWTEETILRASDGAADDGLGQAVALSADGGRALVAATSDDTAAGAARVLACRDDVERRGDAGHDRCRFE